MADIRIFPISKSAGFVEKAAAAMAALPSDPDAWVKFAKPIALAMFDRGVPDTRIDVELCLLRDLAARIAAQRAAAPTRKAQRQLRLVPPQQLDLFTTASDFAIAKMEGDLLGGER